MLLDPIVEAGSHNESNGEKRLYIDFISKLEGWKTRCKNLHWAATRRNIHLYLDDFLEILSDYQDSLAEEIMGLYGPLSALDINGTMCASQNAKDFILDVIAGTHSFYDSIPDKTCTAGVKSECETFIHNCNKYKYLFSISAQDTSF